jgi:sec-independent protein translocase protein TatA
MLGFYTPGIWEIIIILLVALLLFGRRLPEVGRSLGRGIVEFKKGLKGVEDEIDKASDDDRPASQG